MLGGNTFEVALNDENPLTQALVDEANEYLEQVQETMNTRSKMTRSKFGKAEHRKAGDTDQKVEKE